MNRVDWPRVWNEGFSTIDILCKHMRAGIFNKICAHPVIVTWVLGASVLNIFVVGSICAWHVSAIVSDWETSLLILLVIIPTSGLGFFAGMFTCGPFVFIVCKKYNGSPLRIGDRVIILSGPLKGKTGRVYETPIGQGGEPLARVDVSEESAKKFSDLFKQYSVLKISEKSTLQPTLQAPSKEDMTKK